MARHRPTGSDMCLPVVTCVDLLVPRMRVKFGNRAFAVAGPEAWNSLAVDIWSSETVTAFKNCLHSDDSADVVRRRCSDAMLWCLTN